MRKVIRVITNNIGLKILAVIVALVLWMVVVNVEDPDTNKGFTIAVTVDNESYLTEMGKTYTVENGTDTLQISVTGKRSIIEQLSESDFVAVANMQNINDTMDQVGISVSALRYAGQIEISKSRDYMEVSLDDLITRDIEITAQLIGSMAAGYSADEVDVYPAAVTVTGGASLVNEIDAAQVSIDVSGADEDLATNGDIILLDESGSEISAEKLTLNRSSAAVDISVLEEKTVEIEYQTGGSPAENYRVAELLSSLNELKIVGRPEVLDDISVLTIAPDELALDGETESFTVKVDLEKYLPDGLEPAENEMTEAEISVEIEGKTTKTFRLSTDNIEIENLDEGLEAEFDVDSVDVTISDFADVLSGIKESELGATADASRVKGAGTYTLTVTLRNGYTSSPSATVSVTVK